MKKIIANKQTLAILSVICFVALWYLSSNNVQRSCPANTLRVGMMSGWAPFMTVNEMGAFEGFDVDVAHEVAHKLGKKLEIIDAGSLAPLLLMLEQGSIDAAMSGLDITQQRLERYQMIPYYGEAIDHFYLLYTQDQLSTKALVEDSLDGKITIAAEPSSPQYRFLERFKSVEIKPMESIAAMVLDVKFNKSDALIVEEGIMKRLIKQEPAFKSVPLKLPKEFVVYGAGIALRKNALELGQEVVQAINSLKEENVLSSLQRKWELE